MSSRRHSIERTLPVLISALLLVATLALASGTYTRARHALLAGAGPRLTGAAATINVLLERSTSLYRGRLAHAAADPAISTFLATGQGSETAKHALAQTWAAEADARGRVELRGADGKVVLDTTLGVAPLGAPWVLSRVADSSVSVASARVGPIEWLGDTVCYEGIAPIVARGNGRLRTLGYITDLRIVTGTNIQIVRDFIGPRSRMLIGSPATGIWSDFNRRVDPPPADTGRPVTFTPAGLAPVIGVGTAVPGAPWTLWVELPESVVLEPMHALLREIAALAAVVILLGAAGAWLVSRSVTGPIVSLTRATEGVAAGGQAQDVAAVTRNEIARLADAFARMGRRVRDSLQAAEDQKREALALAQELEQQVEETQALSEELEQSNDELRQSVAHAEAANRAKLDFLTHMSHELRTPLNAVSGYVQLLDLEVAGPVADRQRQYLERIRRAASLLLGRINDILNFAKIDSGTLVYALGPVAVREAIQGAVDMVHPLLGERRLTFDQGKGDDGVAVTADREKLEQILLNLLSNAAKFTHPDGRIGLAFAGTGDTVAISVTDTGVGIAANKLASIFEPFVQINPALTRAQEGTGLGLAISRELARGMGGDLTVVSVEGSGSTFTVTLPRAPIESANTPLDDDLMPESYV